MLAYICIPLTQTYWQVSSSTQLFKGLFQRKYFVLFCQHKHSRCFHSLENVENATDLIPDGDEMKYALIRIPTRPLARL